MSTTATTANQTQTSFFLLPVIPPPLVLRQFAPLIASADNARQSFGLHVRRAFLTHIPKTSDTRKHKPDNNAEKQNWQNQDQRKSASAALSVEQYPRNHEQTRNNRENWMDEFENGPHGIRLPSPLSDHRWRAGGNVG